MKKSIFIFLIVALHTLLSCNIQGQEVKNEHKNLYQLEIVSDVIFPILDNAINLFDSIGFSEDSLMFSIDIVKRQNDSVYSIQIEFEDDMDMSFNYIRPLYGYFYYRNCLFIVNGQDSECFFVQTDNTKCFDYNRYSENCLMVIDDSRPYWVYYYMGGCLYLGGASIPLQYRSKVE